MLAENLFGKFESFENLYNYTTVDLIIGRIFLICGYDHHFMFCDGGSIAFLKIFFLLKHPKKP